MRSNMLLLATFALGMIAAVGATGCGDEKTSTATSNAGASKSNHGHDHGPGGEHAPAPTPSVAGHGGPVIDLGAQSIGSFMAKATRGQGQIIAGKDAPIDATLTVGADATAKVIAVRFWIGTEDAKGSVKAKAAVEDPKDPNRWHTHVEIPNPLPAQSKLWIEIEDDKGGKSIGGFELKM